jgi:hypothetical protein
MVSICIFLMNFITGHFEEIPYSIFIELFKIIGVKTTKGKTEGKYIYSLTQY